MSKVFQRSIINERLFEVAKLILNEVPRIQSIREMLDMSKSQFGDKTALEDLVNTPISSQTYNQLHSSVLRFGQALRNTGIPERSHISLIGENRVQWAISYLACMYFNYVVVPIDKNLPATEILNIIHESDSVAVICTEQFTSIFRESGHILRHIVYYITMDNETYGGKFLSMVEMIQKTNEPDNMTLPKINPNDLAEIIFTSGSLGRAKGVMLSQNNLASNLVSMRQMLMIYPEDRFLSVLPIHHTYECTCGMLCPLYSGASVHYARSLKTVVEDLQKVRATILLAVPLLYEKMFKRIYKSINENKVKSKIIRPLITITKFAEIVGWKGAKRKIFAELHQRFGGSVRLFIAGGAAPDPMVAKGLREFGFAFIQGYGLTETSPILTLNRPDSFKDEAAGIPLPGVEVKISAPDQDGVGEIIARGGNVMLGYYKNPVATEAVMRDGWFYTGDIGYFDTDGFLHISGRKKNVIITANGKNVYPEEIEDLLHRSNFIQESLVFADKNNKDKDVIAAQIVPDSEAFIELSEKEKIQLTEDFIRKTIEDVVKKVNEELPSFKRIQKFYIRTREFEKTTTQKIKRYLVQETVPED